MVYANASHAVAAHETLRNRLDGARITAGAGAIVANVAIVMLMLAPVAIPDLRPQMIRMPDVVWIPRERPSPPPPIKVPVRPVQAKVRPAPVARPAPADPLPAQSQAVEGDTQAPPPIQTGSRGTLAPTGDGELGGKGEVLTGTVLEYASAPPPAYPREALREGLTGTVVLDVMVGVDGRPLQAEVVRSSGHRVLDQAARRQVLTRWLFKPAMHSGVPVQAMGRVPVEFRLDR